MTELLHKALTGAILRAYYDVYNGTARIYPERFYDRAMVHELTGLDIRCVQQLEALREWLRAQHISLGLLANFHDTELKPLFLKP